ncbi:MAG: HEAT repeat domain-containing protein [Candidatus Margulisbacteria bacterium]|nr:HEAT repeat domain-containing protein [Candidatus Margulisiibacteriota bacterium]MBU1021378.1 HEAT repeat domain-containing protein [Candidatus Margulisiibacteriota bacterium]MBU1729133.1 HEAT repeat domain-containing protein [Candidatus Margulisiibacteriota bacterium]MBU1954806.1 HEAT repeat domain-containing protein [Candidatus Margulisiibacteriota bacterium]
MKSSAVQGRFRLKAMRWVAQKAYKYTPPLARAASAVGGFAFTNRIAVRLGSKYVVGGERAAFVRSRIEVLNPGPGAYPCTYYLNNAASQLGALRAEEAIKALTLAANHDKFEVQVRISCVEALGKIGMPARQSLMSIGMNANRTIVKERANERSARLNLGFIGRFLYDLVYHFKMVEK